MTINVNSNVISSTGFNTSGDIVNTPFVVTDGLILWLDAGNTASYTFTNYYYDCGYGCQYYASDPGCTNCNTQIKDMSGYGNDGTLSGVTVTYSDVGGTLYFSGSPNYAYISSLANYNFGSDISVCIWHKNLGGDYRGVIANVYSSGTGFDMRYGREDYFGGANNGTRLGCGIRTSVSNYSLDINAELNVWGFYVMTYNGSTLTVYKNGSYFNSVNASGTLGSVANNVSIGRNAGGTEYLTGDIPIAIIYNKALSSTEVLQNFNAGRQRFAI